jgi:hypothetical protein
MNGSDSRLGCAAAVTRFRPSAITLQCGVPRVRSSHDTEEKGIGHVAARSRGIALEIMGGADGVEGLPQIWGTAGSVRPRAPPVFGNHYCASAGAGVAKLAPFPTGPSQKLLVAVVLARGLTEPSASEPERATKDVSRRRNMKLNLAVAIATPLASLSRPGASLAQPASSAA